MKVRIISSDREGRGAGEEGFRAVQVSNDSARKGSDNCLVGSLLFLLSSSLVSVIFVYSLLSFLPTFFPFLFNGCWKWKKQRGRNANCVLFFFFSFSFLLVFGYTWWWDCIIISTAIEETPQTVEIMKLRRGWSNWGWLSPHIWSAKPLPARVLCAYENRVCPPSLLPSSFASFARENSCVSYPFDVVASNKISSDMIDDHADCVVHRFVDLSIV